MSAKNSNVEQKKNGFRPFFFAGGVTLIGLAVIVLILGINQFDDVDSRGESSILSQIPAFEQSGQIGSTAGRLLEVGDVPDNFVLPDLDGNNYELNKLRGRPVLINFWATWCAPCRVEMPELQSAFERHQDDGLVILAIDYGESPDMIRSFFYDEMGLTFTPLLDEKGEVSEQFGVFNLPSTFFISPKGVITAVHRGPLVLEQLEILLEQVIPRED